MKQIIVTNCGTCPYGQTGYCFIIDELILNLDTIHPDCTLPDYYLDSTLGGEDNIS